MHTYKGVVSGGSQPVVDAGAAVLRAGGNAIDALVAASLAITAGEPTVTSLAGGGVLTYRAADTGDVTVLDFFSDAPALRQSDVETLDFYHLDLSYGPTTQRFYIGAGSAAVPGMIPGLFTALEKWGSWSVADVSAPAIAFLKNGTVLGPRQAAMAEFLEPILIDQPGPKAVFAPGGRYLKSGDVFRLPALADTLELLSKQPWRDVYDGPIRDLIVSQFGPSSGGLLTADDLDAYAVVERAPLTVPSPRSTLFVPPAPAAGGQMVGLMRRLVSRSYLSHPQDEPSRAHRLCAAMAVADEARFNGSIAVDGSEFEALEKSFIKALNMPLHHAPTASGGPPSTTHVSVIDGDGNAAALTTSYGESNGLFIGETGILMNNFLGEDDLLPLGLGTATPRARLATMMTPTILVSHEGHVLTLGTGGSNRIRTAILQVLGRLIDENFEPKAAVQAPRLHYENGILNAEIFDDLIASDLSALHPRSLVEFDERNLFFGGVNLAVRYPDGRLDGAGDPRRGGLSVVV